MRKPLIVSLGIVLFGVGIAIGRVAEFSGAAWGSLSDSDHLMYVAGYSDGYAQASVEIGTLRNVTEKMNQSPTTSDGKKIDPLARMKIQIRDQMGLGPNKNIQRSQIKDAMTAFYGDFRNHVVCWPDAFKFAAMSLNGDTPTEDEIQDARKTDAQAGCK